jgi:hypothetical protein
MEYDASKLANPRLVLGDGAPEGSVLTVNANDKGRIGILIDSLIPFTASAMPRAIVMVTFDVIGDGEVPIALTGTLAAQGTSDADGNMLFTRYADAAITVSLKSDLTGTKQN